MRRNPDRLIISVWSPGSNLCDYIVALAQAGWSTTEFALLSKADYSKPFGFISDMPTCRVEANKSSDTPNGVVSAVLVAPGGGRATIEYAGCREPCLPFAHSVELSLLPLRKPEPSRAEVMQAVDVVFAFSEWIDIAWVLLITTSSSSPCPNELAHSASPFISVLYGAYLPFSAQVNVVSGEGFARAVKSGPHGSFWLYDPRATDQVLGWIWPILRRSAVGSGHGLR